ncbi:hypothetical protein ACH4GE_03415 [Streptomyces tendae]|uniref:hypothetical protein n=1 Tax=Streptomyces tendae TaxID=1932 RepID=UPI00378F5740
MIILNAWVVDDAADPHVTVHGPVGAVLRLDPGPPHRVHRHFRANLAFPNRTVDKGR